MDQRNTLFQELNKMQLKISSLFEDLLNEKHEYELNSQNLNKCMEKLFSELNELKKQNKVLKDNNEELKMVVSKCFNILGKCDMKEIKDLRVDMETVQKKFLSDPNKTENPVIVSSSDSFKINLLEGSEKCCSTIRSELDDEAVKKEIESIQKLDFSTQFFDEVEIKPNLGENKWLLGRSKSGRLLEELFERRSPKNSSTLKQEPTLVPETEDFSEYKNENNYLTPGVQVFEETLASQKYIISTPKKSANISDVEESPVFRNICNRNLDVFPGGSESCNDSGKSSPLKLVNEKFLLKPVDVLVSPLKRPASEVDSTSPKIDVSTPKRSRIKSKANSPRTQNSQLKTSNMMDAEVTISGVRKLTQTLLNVEYFRRQSPVKIRDLANLEIGDSLNKNVNEVEFLVEGDEDDVIIESPKSSDQKNEVSHLKSKNINPGLSEEKLLTPVTEPDLDETYVSSSVIKKHKLNIRHTLKPVNEEDTPIGRRIREASPEYDSVPFIYKREAVKKKSERLNLPGHMCYDCGKYYKGALGDANSQDVRKILNKCSRHRDKNPPDVYDTPPGYWKPYLTSSTIQSPNKDVTVTR